ncbi:MAG: M12 family metallo-peptidase [Pseudomonadota bacterium]
MNYPSKAVVIFAAIIAWVLPVVADAETAEVSAHRFLDSTDYQRELLLDVGSESLRFLLNPSSVTAQTTVVDHDGRTVDYTDEAFAGVIDKAPNSWARLTLNRHKITGVYSKEGRQYQISTSIYGKISVNPLSEQHTPLPAQKRNVLALIQQPVTRIADIAIVVDSQYNDYHGGQGVQKALSIINAVDGIYREEFGLAIRVKRVIAITERTNDPFNYGSIPIEQMLRNFRSYRLGSSALSDVSLVHLFTGNRNSDEPVGLAWINTACRSDGYDVGISTPYRHEVLLAAHEIAHNLGAQHDTDTSCASEFDKVMWPYISLNTSQNFSSCTLDTVRRSLVNSCHAETIDLQVSLNQTNSRTVEVVVRNNDTRRANPSAMLKVELPQATIAAALDSRCDRPSGDIECSLGTLLAGQEEKVSFTLLSTPQSDATAEVSVENLDYADPQPTNNHARLLLNDGEIVALLSPEETLPGTNNTSSQPEEHWALGSFGSSDIVVAMLAMLLFRRRVGQVG